MPRVHAGYSRSQAPPRFYLAALEKNWEKAWDQNYATDRKWWTRLVQTESTISGS